MGNKEDKIKAYLVELPFQEQSKKLESHYTSLVFPVIEEDYYNNNNLRKSIIDQYNHNLDFAVKMLKRDFDLDVTTG